MENKGFRLAIVIALGIFLGVLVVSKQRDNAMLTQILNKQNQLLSSQAKFESQATSDKTQGIQAIAEQLNTKIGLLEARLAKLEAQPAARPQAAPQPQMPPPPDNTVYNIPIDNSVPGGAKNGK